MNLDPSIIQRVTHTTKYTIPAYITYPRPERPHYTDERTRIAQFEQSEGVVNGFVPEFKGDYDAF